jgi:serine/threonine-protein kinase RsbW
MMAKANADFGLSVDEYGKMMIAVTEIVMNAIVHGNNEDVSKKVTVVEEHDETVMKITVTDEGEGFNIEHLPDPTTSENILDEHGRGVFIAIKMVEKLDYRHIDGKGTEFTMIVRKK